MKFVKPNILDRTGLTVGEDNGTAYKFGLHLLERAQDCRGTEFHGWHDVSSTRATVAEWFASKHEQVVTG